RRVGCCGDDDVPRSPSFSRRRREAHFGSGAELGVGDRPDDGEGRRAAGGMRSRRSPDRLGSAHRRRRAGRRLPRLCVGQDPGQTISNQQPPSAINNQQSQSTISNQQSAIPMRHRLEYLIVRLLIALMRFTPDWLVRGTGTFVGLTFYVCDGAHRRIARRNLATAFPARPPSERRAIARAAFAHFGRILLELLKFSTQFTAAMLARVWFYGEA